MTLAPIQHIPTSYILHEVAYVPATSSTPLMAILDTYCQNLGARYSHSVAQCRRRRHQPSSELMAESVLGASSVAATSMPRPKSWKQASTMATRTLTPGTFSLGEKERTSTNYSSATTRKSAHPVWKISLPHSRDSSHEAGNLVFSLR